MSQDDELNLLISGLLEAKGTEELAGTVQQLQCRLDLWRLLNPGEQRGPIGVWLLAEAPQKNNLMVWRRELAKVVANNNGCLIYQGAQPRNYLWIVGREAAVKIVRRVYQHLVARVEGLSEHCKPNREEMPAGQKWPNWVRSWHSRWRGQYVKKLGEALLLGLESSRVAFGQELDESLAQEITLCTRWAKQNMLLPPRRVSGKKRVEK